MKYFKITIFYYNPNITPETEYTKRVKELQRFIHEAGYEEDVTFVEGDYDPQVFLIWQGNGRLCRKEDFCCYHCYALRMEEAAKKAAEMGADYFSTTLSISPHKNAQWINEIGENLLINMG
ncbi:MAG: epoxyqueuosine reductase QueH [Anaerobutyricum hallii]